MVKRRRRSAAAKRRTAELRRLRRAFRDGMLADRHRDLGAMYKARDIAIRYGIRL